MKVKNILVKKVLDSRGEWTISVGISDFSGMVVWTSVPLGKSVGKKEAKVVDFDEAQKSVEVVLPALSEVEISSIGNLDSIIESLDPTFRKEKIGGNFSLALSVCVAKILSFEKSVPLWKFLRDEFFNYKKDEYVQPRVYANLINGGLHAKNNLAFQEYMVLTDNLRPMAQTVDDLLRIWHALGNDLNSSKQNVVLGDEGGFSCDFKDNYEPFEILNKHIEDQGLNKAFCLALDAASSSFFAENKYKFTDTFLSGVEMSAKYSQMHVNFPSLFSVEDPFAEEDILSFEKNEIRATGLKVIGDDLTCTNSDLISKYASHLDGVIIKPNQIGTLSRTVEAIKTAEKNNIFTIISHRSAETDETFIIDLAKASNAFAVKIGSPARERNIKYDRLLELY